jgi:copper(I)-binding protein
MRAGRAWWLAAALGSAAPATACEGLEIADAWVREPPPGATAAAAYARLRNTGPKALRIDRVYARDFGMAMLHETVRDGDRVAMRHREQITVPAGGEVRLAPGGLHVMLMQPTRMPPAGATTELGFGCGAAERTTRAPVRADAPP